MKRTEIIDKLKTPVKFFEEDHHYEIDGQRIKFTLTPLLKSLGISPDYSFVKKEVLNEAATRGTTLHSLLEMYDDNAELPPFIDDEFKELVNDYVNKKQDVIFSEFCVSYKTLLATSIDKIICDDDDLIVADVKTTSATHSDSVKWQCSFGAYMLYHTTGLKATKGRLIWLNRKTNKCELKDFDLVSFDEIEKILNQLEQVENLDELKPIETEQSLMVSNDTVKEIVYLVEEEKQVKERLKSLKTYLTELMRSTGVKQAKFEGLQMTYVLPQTKKTFDLKAFQKNNPNIDLTPYYKETEVADSIRITLTS